MDSKTIYRWLFSVFNHLNMPSNGVFMDIGSGYVAAATVGSWRTALGIEVQLELQLLDYLLIHQQWCQMMGLVQGPVYIETLLFQESKWLLELLPVADVVLCNNEVFDAKSTPTIFSWWTLSNFHQQTNSCSQWLQNIWSWGVIWSSWRQISLAFVGMVGFTSETRTMESLWPSLNSAGQWHMKVMFPGWIQRVSCENCPSLIAHYALGEYWICKQTDKHLNKYLETQCTVQYNLPHASPDPVDFDQEGTSNQADSQGKYSI